MRVQVRVNVRGRPGPELRTLSGTGITHAALSTRTMSSSSLWSPSRGCTEGHFLGRITPG